MQYPLWKEEEIPDLISGFEDEDFELLKDRNYDILDDSELTENQMSYHQQARQKDVYITHGMMQKDVGKQSILQKRRRKR